MLGARFRVIVYNNSGTSSNSTNATTTVRILRWYINTSGVPVWEGSGTSPTTIFSNVGAITTGSYDTSDATAQNNSGAANPFLGAEIECTYAATGSPTGNVVFFLQRSVDGATTWPDNGQGEPIAVLYPTSAATYRTVVEYD